MKSKQGSTRNRVKRSIAKKHARRKTFVTQTNRYGLDGRQGKFDLLLKGRLRRKKRRVKMVNITSLDFNR